MLNRRSFMAALAGLPFVGKLFPKADDFLDQNPLMLVTECIHDPERPSAYRNHDWRSGGEVYRQGLGFDEIEFFHCKRCNHEMRVAPWHRTKMPTSYWVRGRDGKPLIQVRGQRDPRPILKPFSWEN